MLRSLLYLTLALLAVLILVDRTRRPHLLPTANRNAAVGIADSTPAPPPVHHPIAVGTTPPDTATPSLEMLARLAVRRRLSREGDRVYLDSLFPYTDSIVTRWPDHSTLSVAFESDSAVAGWDSTLIQQARVAMQVWKENAAGVTLTEASTPDSADIMVRWVETLPVRGQVGSTSVAWGPDGVVHHATVTLALRRNSDSLLLPANARARVVAHELGHAMGLPHSDNSDDLMFFNSPVDEPSGRDQATLRLLYAVPPGPLRILF